MRLRTMPCTVSGSGRSSGSPRSTACPPAISRTPLSRSTAATSRMKKGLPPVFCRMKRAIGSGRWDTPSTSAASRRVSSPLRGCRLRRRVCSRSSRRRRPAGLSSLGGRMATRMESGRSAACSATWASRSQERASSHWALSSVRARASSASQARSRAISRSTSRAWRAAGARAAVRSLSGSSRCRMSLSSGAWETKSGAICSSRASIWARRACGSSCLLRPKKAWKTSSQP